MVKSYQENIPCMVVASREGRNARIPLLRRPPKYFLRKLASYLCSYDIRDLNSGLRIFKKKFYLKNKRFMPKRFSMTSTLTILAAMNISDELFGARRGEYSFKGEVESKIKSLIERIEEITD